MSRTNASFEERWFTPNASPVRTVSAPLETRRGYRPPPPSNGLVFALVSLVLVAMAVTGLVFFFSPPDSKHERPVSTTTVTSSEGWQPPSEVPSAPTPMPDPVKVVTAKDLPPAPPRAPSPKAPAKTPPPTNGTPEFKIKR